jgi:hypothetical protein
LSLFPKQCSIITIYTVLAVTSHLDMTESIQRMCTGSKHTTDLSVWILASWNQFLWTPRDGLSWVHSGLQDIPSLPVPDGYQFLSLEGLPKGRHHGNNHRPWPFSPFSFSDSVPNSPGGEISPRTI